MHLVRVKVLGVMRQGSMEGMLMWRSCMGLRSLVVMTRASKGAARAEVSMTRVTKEN